MGHAKASPLLVCTDREPVLSLRDLVDVPVALVLPPAEPEVSEPKVSEGTSIEVHAAVAPEQRKLEAYAAMPGERKLEAYATLRADAAHGRSPRLVTFELGRNRLALSPQKGDDRKRLAERLGDAASSLDLWEPFMRIREAIEEAQQAAR
jgi:hypothetical protein